MTHRRSPAVVDKHNRRNLQHRSVCISFISVYIGLV
jgi:hypothetical protein